MWNIRNITKVSSFCNLRGSIKRTYLSEAYQLTKEWNQRLETSFLEKINSESLYVDLSTKFQQKKKISAIDVDIYVNKVTEKNLEEAVDVTHKLRTTAQASNILDSTQHALIRLAQNHPDTLISILNHRLDYGIFLSPHTANLLLNKFLLEKNYMVAARIATLQMLQEDFENPITCYMSLYACYKFLHELRTFNDLILPVSIQEEETSKPKKKIEEIKVRVAYLRNPYFDDHFDLKNTNHLLGKTFIALSDEIGHNNSALANSIKLLGFALYEKFEDGAKFIKKSQKEEFCSEVVERVKAFGQELENLSDDEKNFYDSINKISSQNKSKVEEVLETLLQKVVAEQEAKDINDQKELYAQWIETRKLKLNDEINRMERIKRLEDIEKLQEDMNKQEKKLWFFEKYEDIKLEIASKKQYYPKKWFGKKKKPKKMDENYIPIDIESITRQRKGK